jgi:SAM-dependent methyltransferase
MSGSRLAVGIARGRRALRVWGIRATAREAIRYVRTWRARRRWAHLDREFDREHGVDTAGIVPLQALTIESSNRELGHRYQASSADGFRALMAGLDLPAAELTFVDLGAGKGRAMLLASELPFRRVIGVEFAPELCDVARRNVERFSSPAQRCHEFEVVCADAAGYELPDEPALVYIYNSFEEPLMRGVLANVRRSADERPRRLLLALVNRKLDESAMAEAGWRCLVQHEHGELYEPLPARVAS